MCTPARLKGTLSAIHTVTTGTRASPTGRTRANLPHKRASQRGAPERVGPRSPRIQDRDRHEQRRDRFGIEQAGCDHEQRIHPHRSRLQATPGRDRPAAHPRIDQGASEPGEDSLRQADGQHAVGEQGREHREKKGITGCLAVAERKTLALQQPTRRVQIDRFIREVKPISNRHRGGDAQEDGAENHRGKPSVRRMRRSKRLGGSKSVVKRPGDGLEAGAGTRSGGAVTRDRGIGLVGDRIPGLRAAPRAPPSSSVYTASTRSVLAGQVKLAARCLPATRSASCRSRFRSTDNTSAARRSAATGATPMPAPAAISGSDPGLGVHGRRPTRHRLQQREAEPLVEGWGTYLRQIVELRQVFLPHVLEKVNGLEHAELRRERDQDLPFLGVVGPAGLDELDLGQLAAHLRESANQDPKVASWGSPSRRKSGTGARRGGGTAGGRRGTA